jgi:type I restriction enzyme M protein
MAEHLTATGRAAVVVPEGIIFQNGTAYKALRKMLVDTSLVAVVSLPAGVFNPYSGVKTSILFMDKRVHKQTDKVLFVKVQNDGFNLGAQRRAVVDSHLPEATRLLRSWMTAPSAFEGDGAMAQAVERAQIGESGDFNLSGERYIAIDTDGANYPLIKLDDLCLIERGGSPRPIQDYMTDDPNGINWIKIGDAPANSKYITTTKERIRPEGVLRSRAVKPGDFILSNSMSFGRPYIMATDGCIHDGWLLLRTRSDNLLKDYLYLALGSSKVYEQFVRSASGGVVNNLNIGLVKEVSIPLPPLEVQHQIVAEIEGYQKVIDGARQVLDGYKPHIATDPAWPIVTLGDACKAILTGPFGTALHERDYVSDGIPVINPKNIVDGVILQAGAKTVSEATRDRLQEFTVRENDIIIGRRGEMGRCAIVTSEMNGWLCGTGCFVIRLNYECDTHFAHLQLSSPKVKAILEAQAVGVTMMNLNQGILSSIQLPLPGVPTQRAIVAEIEAEQALVAANRELIRRMEAKVKAAIDRVWGAN